MRLRKLSLLNFKNIARQELSFCRGVNCLVGDNGAGKTNVVDAVYYLSMCKSSLPMTDTQSILHGADGFLLETVLRLGDQSGGLFGPRSDDERPVTEDQRCDDEEREDQIRHRTAVLLQKELGPVHCFAERLLPGFLLFCHIVEIFNMMRRKAQRYKTIHNVQGRVGDFL